MRRFVLRERRVRVGERVAGLAVAVTVTLMLAVASGLAAPRVIQFPAARGDATQPLAAERLRYLVVVPADDTRVATAATILLRQPRERPAEATDAPMVPGVSPPSTATARNASGLGVDPGPRVSFAPLPVLPARPAGVTAPPPGRFPGTGTFTAAQQDSVLWKLERSVPYAPRLLPAPAQRDAMFREEAARWAAARELGRPVPVGAVWGTLMPGAAERAASATVASGAANGGFRLPLFSPGPSAGQRRGDSAIHAGNLARMQALADRAKARLDSVRRMDSIAMLTRP